MKQGDFVRTSKGKIGIIVKPERVELGYETASFVSPTGFSWIALYTSDKNTPIPEEIKNKLESSFLTCILQERVLPAEVQLGNKTFPIWEDKLTLVDSVCFKMSKQIVHIKSNLAKTFMEILKENNIHYTLN